MSESILVIGAGGHAKVVIATLEAAGFHLAGVFDDDEQIWGSELLGHRVRGPVSRSVHFGSKGVLAVGDNFTRRSIAETIDLQWATIAHPSAVIHESAQLGSGTVVFAGCVIQPGTVVGAHVIVNTAAGIDHDCAIGDYCHFAPGCRLAGSVSVGEGAFLGIGSCVIPGVRVGAWATVGAGGVVIRDIPDDSVAVGVPAELRRSAT